MTGAPDTEPIPRPAPIGPSDVPPTRLPRALRPFRHREYRLLTASMALSLVASGMWAVGLVWQVIALGGGPSDVSIVMAALSAGLLVAVLFGGVAADRLPRRALLIVVESVRLGTAALAGLLAALGALQVWHLAVLALVIGAAEAFFFPAYTALLPTILPADELLAANGVEGTVRPAAQSAIGPAIAGVLIGAYAPGVALIGAGLLYGLALVTLLFMRPLPQPVAAAGNGAEAGTKSSVLSDLREGFRYMFSTGWFFATLAFATFLVLLILGPIEVLLPFAVRDQTGSDASGYAVVVGAYGIGSMVGSMLMSSLRMPRRYLTVMILAWGVGSLPMAVIGFTDQLWVMVVAMFAVGVAGAVAMVIWGTLLQRRVPPHLLGRVSSLDFFVSLALMPVSMAAAGPVGEALGLPLTFVIAGVVPVALAVVALVGWRLPADEIAHPLDPGPGEEVTAP
ncbi:Predicted arabinose efflux permease, MFS family [Pseudonocardia thermophila]|uniref:Predicted arabinose efflux permease, MFS family n=1 Tax=Pseudonocardia thermophila TaxID=1848 RepID=A0A1M6X5C9_PSETH|nr:MFS transporter [Pseudonocardia thermophila]SHL01227.1 Predicted arabinose efflux permease, MFS family [Pseudonocardia thermophila]